MSLISGNIPSLIQGVSQQPHALRLPSQLESQENCYSSPVEGLTNRPPTEHIAKVSSSGLDAAKMHPMNLSSSLRFSAVLSNGNVQVFDMADGDEMTIESTDETVVMLTDSVAVEIGQVYTIAPATGETSIDFTVSGITTATVLLELSVDNSTWTTGATRTTNGTTTGVSIGSNLYMRAHVTAWTSGTIDATVQYKNFRYLLTSTPQSHLRAVTVADTTFLVNTSKTTRMLGDLSSSRTAEGLIFVKQGNYGSTYAVYVDGTLRASYVTSTTDVEDLATDNIATELYNDLVSWGGSGFAFTRQGSVIWIRKTTGDFTLKSVDSNGGSDLDVFKDTAQKFSDLPTIAPTGFRIAIAVNPDVEDSENYYLEAVVNQTSETFGPVTWTEAAAPGVEYIIDQTVMPHTLTRESNGSFTYEAIDWIDRVAGDDGNNAPPSFIDFEINDVFFYKNRLGFLSDENFILSQVGEYYNFFRTTVTQLKDDDVVDSRVSNQKVSILKNVVAFNKSLVLFSDLTQFQIPGDVAMTPKTVRCDVVSEFESDTSVRPVNSGKVIYFLFERGDYAGIKELFVSPSNAEIMEADEVTAHVPAYIPAGVFSLSVSTLSDISAILTTGDQSSVYLYKSEWKNEKKLQSAIFRWNFDDNTASEVLVLSADFIGDTLYLLIQRDDEVFLEKIRLLPNRVDDDVLYVTLLDRRITEEELDDAVYDPDTNRTTLTLPYNILSTEMVVATRGVEDNTGYAEVGKTLTLVSATVDGDDIVVTGDYTENPLWIGQRYTCEAELSRIYRRQQTQSGAMMIDATANLQLLRGVMTYDKSGAFVVEVTPQGRTTSNYIFTGRITGDINNVLGTIALATGKYKFGILSNNERVTIKITSDEILKFSISSLDWEGEYTNRR